MTQTRCYFIAMARRPSIHRALRKLLFRLRGWLTKPSGLIWSDRYQSWTTKRGDSRIEWTRIWYQDDAGVWRTSVSYGRDHGIHGNRLSLPA